MQSKLSEVPSWMVKIQRWRFQLFFVHSIIQWVCLLCFHIPLECSLYQSPKNKRLPAGCRVFLKEIILTIENGKQIHTMKGMLFVRCTVAQDGKEWCVMHHSGSGTRAVNIALTFIPLKEMADTGTKFENHCTVCHRTIGPLGLEKDL